MCGSRRCRGVVDGRDGDIVERGHHPLRRPDILIHIPHLHAGFRVAACCCKSQVFRSRRAHERDFGLLLGATAGGGFLSFCSWHWFLPVRSPNGACCDSPGRCPISAAGCPVGAVIACVSSSAERRPAVKNGAWASAPIASRSLSQGPYDWASNPMRPGWIADQRGLDRKSGRRGRGCGGDGRSWQLAILWFRRGRPGPFSFGRRPGCVGSVPTFGRGSVQALTHPPSRFLFHSLLTPSQQSA